MHKHQILLNLLFHANCINVVIYGCNKMVAIKYNEYESIYEL